MAKGQQRRGVEHPEVDADRVHARIQGAEIGVGRSCYDPGMWCGACGGQVLGLLGLLGRLAWFRCMSCGAQKSMPAAEVEGLEDGMEWESTEC